MRISGHAPVWATRTRNCKVPVQRVARGQWTRADDMVLSETQRDTRDLVSARSTAAERSYTSPPSARDVATSARHSRPTARCACQVTTVTTEGTSAGRRIDKPSNVLFTNQLRFSFDCIRHDVGSSWSLWIEMIVWRFVSLNIVFTPAGRPVVKATSSPTRRRQQIGPSSSCRWATRFTRGDGRSGVLCSQSSIERRSWSR